MVVNLDLPWNPAVLEQRIGRVHRLGQHRRVRVVNLVSEGTIEHGMIEVLRFKRELFEGVLDGGADTVDMGGTRLTRFMEAVAAVTAAVPATARESDAAGDAEDEAAEGPGAASGPSPGVEGEGAADLQAAGGSGAVLAELAATGARLLEDLSRALGKASPRDAGAAEGEGSGDGRAGATGLMGLALERDAESGAPYLKVSLPKGEALARLAQAARPLLELLASGRFQG